MRKEEELQKRIEELEEENNILKIKVAEYERQNKEEVKKRNKNLREWYGGYYGE